jgi:hypothetical protein
MMEVLHLQPAVRHLQPVIMHFTDEVTHLNSVIMHLENVLTQQGSDVTHFFVLQPKLPFLLIPPAPL